MFKKLGLVGALCLICLGGVAAFAWRELTKLPEWYTETSASEDTSNVLSPESFDAPEDLASLEKKLKKKLAKAQQASPESSVFAPQSSESESTPVQSVPSGSLSPTDAPQREESIIAKTSGDSLKGLPELPIRNREPRSPSIRPQVELNQPPINASSVEGPPPKTARATANVTLTEQEFNELMVVAANKSKRTQPFLDGIQGIKTEIESDQIKSEVVVNLSQVNREKLHPSQLKIIDQLSQQLPSLAQDDLLLTFQGKPQITNGQLKLEPETEISIGGIQTTLAELSQRLGFDLATKPINLNLGELSIQDLQYQDEKLILKTNS